QAFHPVPQTYSRLLDICQQEVDVFEQFLVVAVLLALVSHPCCNARSLEAPSKFQAIDCLNSCFAFILVCFRQSNLEVLFDFIMSNRGQNATNNKRCFVLGFGRILGSRIVGCLSVRAGSVYRWWCRARRRSAVDRALHTCTTRRRTDSPR